MNQSPELPRANTTPAPLTPDQRKAVARRKTLARIRSLREEANRLERLMNGQTR